MQPKYRGNGTPERTGSLSFSPTRRSASTWSPASDRDGHQYRDPRDPEVTMGRHDAHQRGGLEMHLEGPTAAGLMYSDTGGDGPVVVLLHGVLMGGTLWDTVVEGLRDRYRCIVPELPFGAHTTPMPDNADLSLPALATMIAEFLAELDLHHVTLVCNDWGGAQLVISPGGSDRVANLVLVSCEAFDNYPPGLPGRLLCLNAALPGGTFLTAQLLRPRWIRHLPVTFGALSKRRVPEGLFRSWIHPLRHNSKVRRDLDKYIRNVPRASGTARLGRPAAHLQRPGPHRLGTRRQAHAPHPRRTTRRPLPEHPTRVDRRQLHPHPHRPTGDPDRPPPRLPRHAHLTPAVPRSPRAQTRCAPPELRRSVLAAQAECRTPMTSWA